jgi:TIR domain
MADVVILYARQDRLRVEALADTLRAANMSVDCRLPEEAPDAHSDPHAGLRDAGAIIAAWSVFSARSTLLYREAESALREHKLYSVRLDKTRPGGAYVLAPCFDLSRWRGEPSAAVDRLAARVDRDLRRDRTALAHATGFTI